MLLPITSSSQAASAFEARSRLFTRSPPLVERNPIRLGSPLNCGRYYTGPESNPAKLPLYEAIVGLMGGPGTNIFISEAREDTDAIYKWEGNRTPTIFVEMRETFYSLSSLFDLYVFTVGQDWAICLDSAEEVVALGLMPAEAEAFLSGLGGEAEVEKMIRDDLDYLESLGFWPRQTGLFITY